MSRARIKPDRPLPKHVQDAIERGLKRDKVTTFKGVPVIEADIPASMGMVAVNLAGLGMKPKKSRIRVAPKPERTARDGTVFASKHEMLRYEDLSLMRDAPAGTFSEDGTVRYFLRQVPFHLPGGVKYLLDFMVFWADGSITYEDVKGMRTEMYKLKKKQVEALYPIKITEVR